MSGHRPNGWRNASGTLIAVARRAGVAEIRLLCLLVIAAGGLFLFVAIASEMLEGDTAAFDRALLFALRTTGDTGDPIGPGWLEESARDITALGSYPVLTLVALAVFGYLLMIRRRTEAAIVAVSAGGGALVSTLLKLAFARDRPDLVAHAVDVYSASFPSGHAMLSAVVYLTLGVMLVRSLTGHRLRAYVLTICLVTTLLVGTSRVYLGVHWPTDVLAGWCVGASWALACWLVALGLAYRRAPRRGD